MSGEFPDRPNPCGATRRLAGKRGRSRLAVSSLPRICGPQRGRSVGRIPHGPAGCREEAARSWPTVLR